MVDAVPASYIHTKMMFKSGPHCRDSGTPPQCQGTLPSGLMISDLPQAQRLRIHGPCLGVGTGHLRGPGTLRTKDAHNETLAMSQ